MRNIGQGQWRDWRWGNQVVPLQLADPKDVRPEGQKTLTEVACATIRAITAKQQLPQLTDAISTMVKDQAEHRQPESPTGRVSEARFREVLKETAVKVLDPEEVEAIFPTPHEEKHHPRHRRGSHSKEHVKRGHSKNREEGASTPTDTS